MKTDFFVRLGFDPSVFHRQNGQSAVLAQPTNESAQLRALQAAVACPTGSIRTEVPHPLSKQAALSFPFPFPDLDGVYYNGYASPGTFGASSWLITTPIITVMFDCPRFSSRLAARIKETSPSGRVDFLVLSHRDDVDSHAAWAKHLGTKRVIHSTEVSTAQGTHECEIQLDDRDFDGMYHLGDDIHLLHTPGHTEGSITVWSPKHEALLSGDHCWGSSQNKKQVSVSKRFCFYDFELQLQNVRALAELPVRHILPGHGRPVSFDSVEEGQNALRNVSA